MKNERGHGMIEYMAVPILALMALLLVLSVIGPVLGEKITDTIQHYNLDYSHAVQKHGSQAVAVRLAHNKCGADFEFYHEDWDRTACVIEFDDEKGSRWGVRILDGENERTAFIQRAGRSWEEFVKYMQRRGYELVK